MKQVTVRGLELIYDDKSPENFFTVLDVINNALQDAGLECQPQITISSPNDSLDITVKDLDDGVDECPYGRETIDPSGICGSCEFYQDCELPDAEEVEGNG